MSLLSQFFPSGSGSSSTQVKTNILIVGGGSGGLPAGGAGCPPNASYNYASGGGGGGSGQVYEFINYQISSGNQITVTIGSGGGASSNGGETSVCVTGISSFVAKGGRVSTLSGTGLGPVDNCTYHEYFYDNNSALAGSGSGGTAFFCWTTPSPVSPGPGGCVTAAVSGSVYCGLPSCFSPTNSTLCNSVGNNDFVRKFYGRCGGTATTPPSTCYYSTPYAAPSNVYRSGSGGGGGGGATSDGANGSVKAGGCFAVGPYGTGPYVPGPVSPCIPGTNGGGSGGSGGSCMQTRILGTLTYFGSGGGGGGGNFNQIASTYTPCRPSLQYCNVRGSGGLSCSGGCGGCGGNSSDPNYPQIPAVPGGCPGCNATANTGGGGGGGGAGPTTQGTGGSGGSGVVVIQYPTLYPTAPAFPGACDCSPSTPGSRTYKFNGPGSITLP